MSTPPPFPSVERSSPILEFALVLAGFSLLTVWFTWPLAAHLGTLGYRLDNGDGQFSVWNVAWVAHALLTNPRGLFNANIFYPHRGTLAYSEANIGAGLLATPAYSLTQNPFAAHNFVLLASFVLSATATYYLSRHLFSSRRAAVVAAICFAYTPYVVSHLLQIQIIMTFGIPLSLLAFHRLTDQPTVTRGLALGGAMWLQALFCAYYGVFMMLVIGYAVFVIAVMRGWWWHRQYWLAVAAGAVTGGGLALALFAPQLALRQIGGHVRPVEAAIQFSADWRSYLASAAYAHGWMLAFLGHWRDVLFPGFVATIGGIGGLVVCARGASRSRELVVLYGGLIALACWASFGPAAGLYRALYAMVPGFSFMRAPGRFGVLVIFGLAVMVAGFVSRFERSANTGRVLAAALAVLALVDLAVPLQFAPLPPVERVYRLLARMPRGALVELPAYSRRSGFRRTRYMLASTHHWMPLVNGYSDYIPPDFEANLETIGEFPTRASLDLLAPLGVRYAIFHVGDYRDQRDALVGRLNEFAAELRPVYVDEHEWLYEIVNPGPLR